MSIDYFRTSLQQRYCSSLAQQIQWPYQLFGLCPHFRPEGLTPTRPQSRRFDRVSSPYRPVWIGTLCFGRLLPHRSRALRFLHSLHNTVVTVFETNEPPKISTGQPVEETCGTWVFLDGGYRDHATACDNDHWLERSTGDGWAVVVNRRSPV